MTTALVPDPATQPTMQVGELPKVLGISRAAAYEAVKTGEIPSIRIGRRIVVPTAAVRRMLQLDSGPDAA
jgi:excisionase family DNA binding protein